MEMSFDESLRTYVEIDDELKRVTQEAKTLRKNKATLESAISTHMVENDIPEHRCLDASRVKIFKRKSTKSAFNKAGVYECAQVMFGSDKAKGLVALLEDKKDVKESFGLKRTGAPICNCEDTKSTVTENWVKMLETQQETIFPFTLWPLTYRTSAVIASTSLFSPSLASVKVEGTDDVCRVVLKLYMSNDVLIMCFQHVGNHSTACPELCKFNSDAMRAGHGVHSSDKKHPLVPCGLMNLYSRIKKKAMIELMKFRTPDNSFSCIICTGYEMGGVLATFMACDLANEFKSEAEFMGLDKPMMNVDCVCFSIPKIANATYWQEFDSLVDKHLIVKHKEEIPVDHPKTTVFVGNKDVPLRTSMSVYVKNMGRTRQGHNRVPSVPCLRYVEDIDNTIRVLG